MSDVVGASGQRIMTVLFVCTGNICRSPTAEAVFRQKLRNAELAGRCGVDSAGTIGYHAGAQPDSRALREALRAGYSMDGIIARRITTADFAQNDLILGCDTAHVGQLKALAPQGCGADIGLLGRYADGRGIEDPYYEGADAFAQMLRHVEQCCDGLLAELAPLLGASCEG